MILLINEEYCWFIFYFQIMDANKIGEWAGIVWRLLSKENREMTFEEVMSITGLDERQLAGAIGWLAREDKIIFNAPHDGKLANLSLMLNLYID